jgi:hypothetical protein
MRTDKKLRTGRKNLLDGPRLTPKAMGPPFLSTSFAFQGINKPRAAPVPVRRLYIQIFSWGGTCWVDRQVLAARNQRYASVVIEDLRPDKRQLGGRSAPPKLRGASAVAPDSSHFGHTGAAFPFHHRVTDRRPRLNFADGAPEIPTVDELRKKLAMLSDQISDVSDSGLEKAAAQVRDRPLFVVLAVLFIGLIGGYLLKR